MNTNIFDIDDDQNSSGVYKHYQWLIRKHTPKVDSLRFKKRIITKNNMPTTYFCNLHCDDTINRSLVLWKE